MARLHARLCVCELGALLLAALAASLSCQPSPDVRSALLAQRLAISNWGAFSAANGIQGWDPLDTSSDVCTWTGIGCSDYQRGNVTNVWVLRQQCRPPAMASCAGSPAQSPEQLSPTWIVALAFQFVDSAQESC